ncbi:MULTISPECIES: hypothetical protein [Bradyrhizobium]|jgi:hypothetical protein|uniref:Uncharacterized protein n=1 Tax=Bradyrhizobium elkanii TaxID=29448 RepID=A0A8I2C3G2_BRAEL|nr:MULTISPECIES: hypothetical protein [Bradyrhizobium]MBP1293544.1 hypothetical protein [Bradyrhizobium elkanii]MCP1925871.1 hypothetical protein [Bradyrhizobium elkanii]MCS3476637.1 hypothetical protein [Bradyrhizobium elkanii]MCS3566468.1 hypothetical protein [Bradyrhizobium elkanii]MCS3583375.1 hypothetical protein [Bradyrhizobium elkanii]
MNSDRTILFARCRDGHTVHQFAHRVTVDRGDAVVGGCDHGAAELSELARREWQRHSARLPLGRRSQLVSEMGRVVDLGNVLPYSVVHANGNILDGLQSPRLPSSAEAIKWADVAQPCALLLGPSATLALVDFILDGIPGTIDDASWPFDDRLLIHDTGHSPYPPQHRAESTPCRVGAGITHRDEGDDIAFMLLQRSEVWQRPVNALYNMRQRNLAIQCDTIAPDPCGAVVVLDTLSAEVEPTLSRSSWLATWYLTEQGRSCWGEERLAVVIDTSGILRSDAVAVGRPWPACICDPIEGECYGTAPHLLVQPTSLAIKVLA